MHDEPIDPFDDVPEPAYWSWIDAITTDCPLCAFVRGTLFGLAVAGIALWLT